MPYRTSAGPGEQAGGLRHEEQPRQRDLPAVGPQQLAEPAQHLGRVGPGERLLDRVLPERPAAAAPHHGDTSAISPASAWARTSR